MPGMKLGDLEFTADDLSPWTKEDQPAHEGELQCMVRNANQALAEKLGKAIEVKGWEDYFSWRHPKYDVQGYLSSPVKLGPATHTARLVCIEEIEK